MGVPVHINIEEIRKPELDAQLVAHNVAQQLERTSSVSARDEARNAECDASWCPRYQGSGCWTT